MTELLVVFIVAGMIELLVALYNEYLGNWAVWIELVGKDYPVMFLPLDNRDSKFINAEPILRAFTLDLHHFLLPVICYPHAA